MTTGRFFDNYPQFYSTSNTAAHPDRLNDRHRAIIDFNRDIIRGSRILDIASHDGRWSFAAIKSGAKKVTGIEIRHHLVENSIQNMRSQNIDEGQYEFICGDALKQIAKLPAGEFDIVMCLGYLYHTIHIPELIHQIGRLTPRHVILDTATGVPVEFREPKEWVDMSGGKYGKFFMARLCEFLSAQPLIVLHEDDRRCEGMGVEVNSDDPWVPVGYPTKGALELLLGKAGFSDFVYYDWINGPMANWSPLWDYCMGYRVTMRCSSSGVFHDVI
jgi:ubiquinone/menaquinone biosynthesis C-methylase UbiE